MSQRKRKQSEIDLKVRKKALPVCHRTELLKGGGEPNMQFGGLLERLLKRAKKQRITGERPERKGSLPGQEGIFDGSIFDLFRLKQRAVPPIRSADYDVLVAGASALQSIMVQDQFTFVTEQIVGDMSGRAHLALSKMPTRYTPGLTGHARQLDTLRSQLDELFPKLIREIANQNPNVPLSRVLQHAVDMVVQELAPQLSILQITDQAVAQWLDGRNQRLLNVVNTYMEGCFRLYLTGDLDGGTGQKMPTSAFQVGDAILSFLGGMGLGTIPGSAETPFGPIGLHLLMMPFDMKRWVLPLGLPLLGHESRHQVAADIFRTDARGRKITLLDDQRMLTAANVLARYKSGQLKLKNATTRIGRTDYPTIELAVKFVTDALGEIDSDTNGGIQTSGLSFLNSMLFSFPAWAAHGPIKDMDKLLRDSTVYSLVKGPGGRQSLEFEAHPQDIFRAWTAARALELRGYADVAKRFRANANEAVGGRPSHLTWKDSAGKGPDIIMDSDDLEAVNEVVVDTLLNAQIPSLNGLRNSDLVSWDNKKEVKVNRLVGVYGQKKPVLPTDMGSIHVTYLGAAGARYFWNQLEAGAKGEELIAEANDKTIDLFEQLAERSGS